MISKSPEGLQYDEGRLKFLRDERGKLDAACQTGEQISRRKATLALRAVVVSLAFITIGCQKVGMEPEKARKQLDQNAIELLYKQADLVNDALKKYTPEVFGLPENEYKARIRSEAFTFLLNREQSEFPDLFRIGYGPFTDDSIPECVVRVFWEKDPNAQYYYFWTNFWKRFPLMQLEDTACTDEYVISVVDGRVTGIKGRATLPY